VSHNARGQDILDAGLRLPHDDGCRQEQSRVALGLEAAVVEDHHVFATILPFLVGKTVWANVEVVLTLRKESDEKRYDSNWSGGCWKHNA